MIKRRIAGLWHHFAAFMIMLIFAAPSQASPNDGLIFLADIVLTPEGERVIRSELRDDVVHTIKPDLAKFGGRVSDADALARLIPDAVLDDLVMDVRREIVLTLQEHLSARGAAEFGAFARSPAGQIALAVVRAEIRPKEGTLAWIAPSLFLPDDDRSMIDAMSLAERTQYQQFRNSQTAQRIKDQSRPLNRALLRAVLRPVSFRRRTESTDVTFDLDQATWMAILTSPDGVHFGNQTLRDRAIANVSAQAGHRAAPSVQLEPQTSGFTRKVVRP